MKTFPFCKTNEAEKRMNDGDVIQNIESEVYYKKEEGVLYSSLDHINWEATDESIVAFPPYADWRSIPNLHYYNDIKEDYPDTLLSYMVPHDKKVLTEEHDQTDKTKKRWFVERML